MSFVVFWLRFTNARIPIPNIEIAIRISTKEKPRFDLKKLNFLLFSILYNKQMDCLNEFKIRLRN